MKRAIGWAVLAALVIAAAWSGVVLRYNLWDWTTAVRFNGDINNGFHWGKFADHVGYFNVYDELGTPMPGTDPLDYGPLRLGVMSSWVQWLKPRHENLDERERDPKKSQAYHAPLLWFNTAMEATSTAAAWMVTLHIVRRSSRTSFVLQRDNSFLPRGMLTGFAAAMLVWFDPLILWNAHAWPQWDIWPMPFYLLAVYCGCRRWWLAGGLLVGVGALLKGQMLMVAWTLPLWALFIGDWRGMPKFIVGAMCSIALGGSVWLLSIYLPGAHHFDVALSRGELIRRANWPAIAWVGLWLGTALLLPRRIFPAAICAALGLSLFSTLWLFGGSNRWIESGFEVGTWRYPTLYMGTTSNLPALLHDVYHYQSTEYVCYQAPLPAWMQSIADPVWHACGGDAPTRLIITLRTLMLMVYFPLCVFSTIFAAINDRRNDRRFAMAIGLPWLLFYILPLQIHERYLLFYSTCAALLVAAGLRFALLGFIVTLAGLAATMHTSFASNGIARGNDGSLHDELWPTLHAIVAGTHPGIAWLVLLALVIFLYSIIPPAPKPGSLIDASTH